jgi:phenylacetic acid degradation operon negative regulatory protein
MRAQRHQLRAHLTHLGFGNVGTAMWIAPARMRKAAERAVSDLGLDAYAAIFVGDYHGPRDLTELLYNSWDLAAIDQSYRDFVQEHGTRATRLDDVAPTGREAFAAYLGVLDNWRKLPFRDPGLPREVLAPDWSAPEATALFERLVTALEKPALRHASTYWPSA